MNLQCYRELNTTRISHRKIISNVVLVIFCNNTGVFLFYTRAWVNSWTKLGRTCAFVKFSNNNAVWKVINPYIPERFTRTNRLFTKECHHHLYPLIILLIVQCSWNRLCYSSYKQTFSHQLRDINTSCLLSLSLEVKETAWPVTRKRALCSEDVPVLENIWDVPCAKVFKGNFILSLWHCLFSYSDKVCVGCVRACMLVFLVRLAWPAKHRKWKASFNWTQTPGT